MAINVAEMDAGKAAALPLHGDARVTLAELQEALEARGWQGTSAERRASIERLRVEWNDEVERVRHLAAAEHVSQPEVIRLVNEAAGEDGVVVCAAGGLPGDLHKIWRASGPDTYHMEYGYSTMGYEIAGGLGVAMAEPERRVYVMVGDGSYLMLANEIADGLPGRRLADHRAPRQPRLPLHPQPLDGAVAAPTPSTTSASATRDRHVHRRGAAHRLRRQRGQPRGAGPDRRRRRPGWSRRWPTPAGMEGGPVVIVVEVNPEPSVPDYDSWWDVPVAEVSSSPRVQAARREYEANLARERSFV